MAVRNCKGVRQALINTHKLLENIQATGACGRQYNALISKFVERGDAQSMREDRSAGHRGDEAVYWTCDLASALVTLPPSHNYFNDQ